LIGRGAQLRPAAKPSDNVETVMKRNNKNRKLRSRKVILKNAARRTKEKS
jgi:hypothetical protein